MTLVVGIGFGRRHIESILDVIAGETPPALIAVRWSF
jgi:hypothetical protein